MPTTLHPGGTTCEDFGVQTATWYACGQLLLLLLHACLLDECNSPDAAESRCLNAGEMRTVCCSHERLEAALLQRSSEDTEPVIYLMRRRTSLESAQLECRICQPDQVREQRLSVKGRTMLCLCNTELESSDALLICCVQRERSFQIKSIRSRRRRVTASGLF